MQRGFVFCDADFSRVLCIGSNKSTFELIDVDSTKALNKAMCMPDLTEAKNVLKRLDINGMNGNLQITNVARLYKKFF